jgi:integrase
MITKREPTKDGRKYVFVIRYKDIYGKTVQYQSKRFATAKEAKEQEAIYRLKVSENKINRSNVTFKDIKLEYYEYMKPKLKPQTLSRYPVMFSYLEPLDSTKINDFNVNIYSRLYNDIIKKKLSARYVNKILGMLRSLIKYSNKYYNTSDEMLKFIENLSLKNETKEMDFYTFDEYTKFRSVIDDEEWLLFFDMLYFLGFRKGELQALTYNDIDPIKKEVSINKTLTTKLKGTEYYISSPKTKSSNRILPIPNDIFDRIEKNMQKYQKYTNYSDLFFIFGGITPFKDTNISNKNIQYSKLANLRTIRIHDFRHSCASLLINQNMPITLVSKYLGHSKVSVTLDTYSHMYKSDLNTLTDYINKLKF